MTQKKVMVVFLLWSVCDVSPVDHFFCNSLPGPESMKMEPWRRQFAAGISREFTLHHAQPLMEPTRADPHIIDVQVHVHGRCIGAATCTWAVYRSSSMHRYGLLGSSPTRCFDNRRPQLGGQPRLSPRFSWALRRVTCRRAQYLIKCIGRGPDQKLSNWREVQEKIHYNS
jgi:hypothetical protein